MWISSRRSRRQALADAQERAKVRRCSKASRYVGDLSDPRNRRDWVKESA